MKKVTVYLLMFTFFICLFPVCANAATTDLGSSPVELDICDGDIKANGTGDVVTYTQAGNSWTTTGGCVVTQSDPNDNSRNITITSGYAKITLYNVSIETSFTWEYRIPILVKSGAKLSLSLLGTNSLKAIDVSTPGIEVPEGAELTIGGSGSLQVSALKAPAIGDTGNVGSITITSGTVTATGGEDCPGIGVAGAGNKGGTITITGGNVTANGGEEGSGIGGGYSSSHYGTINISGGTVTAVGGKYGAGIGNASIGSGTAGTVNISGGTVTATGGYARSGIGNAESSITISGGTVTATGGEMGGYGIQGYQSIVIHDGKVHAIGGDYGAGIGGAAATISIYDGEIIATGGQCAAGIGGGLSANTNSISIFGGEITATGGKQAAGIGGGRNGSGGTIHITNGVIDAFGGEFYGAGIGGGDKGSGGNITISGGTVNATGGSSSNFSGAAGLGGGNEGAGGTITITGGQITVKSGWYSSAIGGGTNGHGGSISISNASVKASGALYAIGGGNHANEYGCEMIELGSNVQLELEHGAAYSNYQERISITAQPESVSDYMGSPAVFRVSAHGYSGLSYQWQWLDPKTELWTDLDKETGSELTVHLTKDTMNTSYRCALTNGRGNTIYTEPASLTISAVTWSTELYLEQEDGTYVLAETLITKAEAGETVTAQSKDFEHYTENPNLGITSGTVEADCSLVLSRYYQRSTYQILFEVGAAAEISPLSAKWGTELELPTDVFAVGVLFDGWYLDAECTLPMSFTVMPCETVTVYAKWIPISEAGGVTHRLNGITLREHDGASGIPAGKHLADVSITNLASDENTLVLLAFYTADGKYLEMKQAVVNAFPLGTTHTVTVELDNTAGDIAQVKAFMVVSFENPTPVCAAKTLGTPESYD